VGGNVTFSDNRTTVTDGSSNTIVLGESDSVAGDVTISGNSVIADGSSNTIFLSEIDSVGGDLMISENTSPGGRSSVDVSGTIVEGDVNISTSGSTRVSGSTGGGDTSVTLVNGSATMNALLPENTFATNVPFTIESLGNAGSLTGPIVDGSSNTVMVTELAAYRFTFAITTLNQDATLTFDIAVAELDEAGQSALLAAVASSTATLGVQGDAPGSLAQVFVVCGAGEPPTAGGCIQVVKLGASGEILPDGAFVTPSIVRFIGVTGHFSTFAVVIVSPIPDTTPPVISDVPASIVAEATSAAGAVVTYASPVAIDDRDGAVAVSCAPASGSTFPLGISTVTCTASDAAGNDSSASFTVTTAPRGAELSITSTDSPDPATLGSPLTYTVAVRNNGPSRAKDVWMVHAALGKVRLVSATASQGQCMGIFGLVGCNFGTLANGATATVTIVVIPKVKGDLCRTAYVLSPVIDPNAANNQASATTRVQ
jgi:uncharacterized repeat protein (TIGR01451 family)